MRICKLTGLVILFPKSAIFLMSYFDLNEQKEFEIIFSTVRLLRRIRINRQLIFCSSLLCTLCALCLKVNGHGINQHIGT